MIWQEMLNDERIAGREEGRMEGRVQAYSDSLIELLENLGEVSSELREQIQCERDLDKLQGWFKQAMKAKTIEDFLKIYNL